MTTNDVSDTRISTERLRHFIAYVDLMGSHSDLCVDAWEAKAMAIEILASRHPQPANKPGEWGWRSVIDDPPRGIGALARFFDDELGDYVYTVFDGGPLKFTLAAPYTEWLPLDTFKRTLRAASIAAPEHPDDLAVDAFAAKMKAKLKWEREERNRSGWQNMTEADLSRLLMEHLPKGDPVDVANFCMMLSENGQRIAQPAPERSKEETGVKVKPLKWSKTKPSFVADTPVGTWEVRYDGLGEGLKATGLHAFTVWWEDALCLGQFQLEEEAKAAAQADYEQRILSALETPPLHKEGDHIPATSEDQATCDDCAGLVISWRAPDALWNQVMGGPNAKDDPGGIICPNCFIRRAELAGVAPAAWLVDAPQPTPVASVPLEDGPVAWQSKLGPNGQWADDPTGFDPEFRTKSIAAGAQYRPLYASPAPLPVTITPEMREVMWAEVVFEGEGNRFLLACDEEGNLDGVHHEMSIELSADTFPVGTKIVVSEPARESTND